MKGTHTHGHAQHQVCEANVSRDTCGSDARWDLPMSSLCPLPRHTRVLPDCSSTDRLIQHFKSRHHAYNSIKEDPRSPRIPDCHGLSSTITWPQSHWTFMVVLQEWKSKHSVTSHRLCVKPETNMSHLVLHKLVESIPACLNAVIRAEGRHTVPNTMNKIFQKSRTFNFSHKLLSWYYRLYWSK